MKPRLLLFLALVVPGAGPLCARQFPLGIGALLIAALPVLCGLPWPYYLLGWLCAQLWALYIASLISRRG